MKKLLLILTVVGVSSAHCGGFGQVRRLVVETTPQAYRQFTTGLRPGLHQAGKEFGELVMPRVAQARTAGRQFGADVSQAGRQVSEQFGPGRQQLAEYMASLKQRGGNLYRSEVSPDAQRWIKAFKPYAGAAALGATGTAYGLGLAEAKRREFEALNAERTRRMLQMQADQNLVAEKIKAAKAIEEGRIAWNAKAAAEAAENQAIRAERDAEFEMNQRSLFKKLSDKLSAGYGIGSDYAGRGYGYVADKLGSARDYTGGKLSTGYGIGSDYAGRGYGYLRDRTPSMPSMGMDYGKLA